MAREKEAIYEATPGVEIIEDDSAANPADDGTVYADPTKDEPTTTDSSAADTAAPVTTEEPTGDDELPEEFKGKSPAQIAKMYKELHSRFGQQGSELGQLRQLTDAMVRKQLAAGQPAAPKPAEAPKQPDPVDFYANPEKAVADLIANHPEIKRLKGAEQELRAREVVRARQASTEEFFKTHPDAGEILNNPEFRAWVEKSDVRKAMLLRAHQSYDVKVGNELFGTWKELQAARQPAQAEAAAAAKTKQAAQKKAARVPAGGTGGPAADTSGGKIFRRADVLRLMTEDPDRYELMQNEIQQAYIEGRVR